MHYAKVEHPQMRVWQAPSDPVPVASNEYNGVATSVAASAHCEIFASSDCLSSKPRQQSLAQLLALLGRHRLDIDFVLFLDTDIEGDRPAAWA
jgi:hypothetical protein